MKALLPLALAMDAWSSAAQEAGIAIADQPSGSSAVALRQRNKIEMEQRAFGAIASTEAVASDSDESAYGHVKDATRDAAKDDRTFARSTAKLTPALFAEMTGGPGYAARGARSQPSTVVVSEIDAAEPEGAAAVASMYSVKRLISRTFSPHRATQSRSGPTVPHEQIGGDGHMSFSGAGSSRPCSFCQSGLILDLRHTDCAFARKKGEVPREEVARSDLQSSCSVLFSLCATCS